MSTTGIKCYSDLTHLKTLKDRYDYLKIGNRIEWNGNRWLNQQVYRNLPDWQRIRRLVLIRDNGMDLGVDGIPIQGKIIVHHINPITDKDIINRSPKVLDMENLICCSMYTHDAIHYGDEKLLPQFEFIERKPFDTCPWKGG